MLFRSACSIGPVCWNAYADGGAAIPSFGDIPNFGDFGGFGDLGGACKVVVVGGGTCDTLIPGECDGDPTPTAALDPPPCAGGGIASLGLAIVCAPDEDPSDCAPNDCELFPLLNHCFTPARFIGNFDDDDEAEGDIGIGPCPSLALGFMPEYSPAGLGNAEFGPGLRKPAELGPGLGEGKRLRLNPWSTADLGTIGVV